MTPLEGPSGPLVFEAPPSDGAFLLTGRRAVLNGHARVGVARLTGGSGEMIRALRPEEARCRAFRYSPGSLLRELVHSDGAGKEALLREVVLVPRDFPGAVFQWRLAEDAAPLMLAVSWRPGEELAPVEDDVGEGVLVTLEEEGEGGRRVFVLGPGDGAWTRERSGGPPRLTTELAPGASAVLVVTEGDAPPDPGVFRRIRDWERARLGQETQAEDELLTVHRDGTRLREAVSWARARLDTPAPAASVSDRVWLGLGGLVVGLPEVARRVLASVEQAGEEGGGAPALLREQGTLWAGLPGPSPEGDEAPGLPVAGEGLHPVLRDPVVAARAAPVDLARALCALVAGTLGARPDAPVGRLTLSPALPPSWSDLRVENLPVGDVRVFLGYRREGHRHTFTLRQGRGRVPLNLVFRPLVSESDLVAVRVDGESAELDRIRRRGRVGTPIQLPLDREREVVLEGKP